jgi:transposase-like protein
MPRIYSDGERATVYISLQTGAGNIRRASRETGVPEQTIRDWKRDWETSGVPPEVEEAMTSEIEDSLNRMERVRDKALALIEGRLHEHKPRELATLFGILDDKIRLTKGLATARTETTSALPSPEEMKALFSGMIAGAIAMQAKREQEVDIVEQAELPALNKGD